MQAFPAADASRIDQHSSGPAIDVKVANEGAQAAHPFTLFEIGHGQSPEQHFRCLFDMVRVDDQASCSS